MKYKALILLLILLTSSGCGSSNSTPSNKGENSKGIIKGTVTAASSVVFKGKSHLSRTAFAGNAGVAGAVCILEGSDKNATTDANGFFQMSDIPVGSYVLICKKTATDGKVYAFLEIVEVQDGETVDLGTVDIKKTGGIQGKATLADLPDHTGISVYIPGTSMQARTDATGAYLINDVPEGTYELHFEKSGYITGKITGLPVTAGETALAEDMSLSLSTGASGIISIENGKVYSNSRTVTVYFTTSDDARLHQISDNPNFIGAVWNTIPSSRTWIFDSDGEKRLYAKFADANGLESAPVSDSIVVDTTPPVNGSISINKGASATNSTSVTLNLSATDATTSVSQMKISNTPDFAGTEWESFVTTRSWTIPAGDGTKTVYVMFKDIVGNETTQAISDDIILDTTIPASPSVTIQEGAYTNNTQIHLNLYASGATFMKVSEDSTFAGIQTIPYAPTTIVTLSAEDGDKTIYVKYIDDAGNESDLISVSVVLDTMPPITPVIFNPNQTSNQTTFMMTLSTPSTDPNFKTYQLKGGHYPDWTDTTETTAFNFTLIQQGANILSIRGKDLAGNVGNTASVIVPLDTINPILSNITSSTTGTTATITWVTSEPTYGHLDYGLNQNYGFTQSDDSFSTSHTVLLTDLFHRTLYHYRITSTDSGQNITTSTNLTFETGTDVEGLISTETMWTLANSPYWLTNDIQIAYGTILTIEPGVVINGSNFGIKVFGTLNAVGSNTSEIVFNNVRIIPGNSAATTESFIINLQFSEIISGSLYYPTGNAIYGNLILKDSKIQDVPYVYLWYPVADCYIERNIFINSGGISGGTSGNVIIYIRNNVFYQQSTPYAVENWASYNTSETIVEYNSFLSNDRIGLILPSGYTSARITAVNNYWNTINTSIIDSMIFDKNDDLGSAAYIIYNPILSSPHITTPPFP